MAVRLTMQERVAEGDAIVTRLEKDRSDGVPYRVTAGDGYASVEVSVVASVSPSDSSSVDGGGANVCRVRKTTPPYYP